jgi:hypothetical protein
LHSLEVIREVFGGDQPFIGGILWITSDHIARLWATGAAIDVGYGDAIQVVTMLVRPHLSDLFSTVLFVLGHLSFFPLTRGVLPEIG